MSVTLSLPDRAALWTEADSRSLSLQILGTVVARTRDGIDADGHPFKAMADGTPCDLIESGSLIGGLRASSTATTATVSSAAPYAAHVEAAGRRFLDLTAGERAELVDQITETIIERAGAKA